VGADAKGLRRFTGVLRNQAFRKSLTKT